MAKEKNLNGYDLTRQWFDYAFENAATVSANHTALYMFLINLNNRLGWVPAFGLTAAEGMLGMSCKNRNTYFKSFNDLVTWGFVNVIKPSKNQYQCNIISLSSKPKTTGKSLEKAVLNNECLSECQPKIDTSTDTDTNTSTDISTDTDIDTIHKTLNLKPETLNIIPDADATGGTEDSEEDEKKRIADELKKEETELFNKVKSSFMAYYQKTFESEYYFEAKDGAKIKALIKKIKTKIKEKNSAKKESIEIGSEDVLLAFNYYIRKAYEIGDNWINSNFTLPILDSKFNELYTQIKNGKNGKGKNIGSDKESKRSELEAFKGKSGEFLQEFTAEVA